MGESGSVRQSLLQLQLQCQAGALTGGRQEEEEPEEGEQEQNGPQPDLKKYFRHLDSRERRGGVASPGLSLASTSSSSSCSSYSHTAWWAALAKGGKGERPAPNSAKVGGRIDPLKNKELYDDEASEDDEGSETVKASKDEEPQITSETKKANKAALSSLTRHLDLVATCGEEGEGLSLSSSLTSSPLCLPSLQPVLQWGEAEGITEATDAVLDSELVVHRIMLGRVERMEVLSSVLLSRPFLNGHARLNGRLGEIARFSPVFL